MSLPISNAELIRQQSDAISKLQHQLVTAHRAVAAFALQYGIPVDGGNRYLASIEDVHMERIQDGCKLSVYRESRTKTIIMEVTP